MVRGGLAITAGILAGNVLGVLRVAVTAYLVGTSASADALAVGIGSIDGLNHALLGAMIYAFVPGLAAREGAERVAFFLRLRSVFAAIFCAVSTAILLSAPWLAQLLAPGAPDAVAREAAAILRIGALSTVAIGIAAVHSALLYTERRFAPSAFQQAVLNTSTLAAVALLWKPLGVLSFPAGYAVGAWVQLGIVMRASRRHTRERASRDQTPWTDLIGRPSAILVYTSMLVLNVTLTRAFATHLGPGTAAAFEYSMRCLGAPLAILTSPVTNTLLPEIARLRAGARLREAFRLIDGMVVRMAAVAGAAALLAVAVRRPVIALLFQRGSFTAESTALVAAVFLGFAPVLVGWSLMELVAKSTFALDRAVLPIAGAAVAVAVNWAVLASPVGGAASGLGVGASCGLVVGAGGLYALVRRVRGGWGVAR